MVHTLGGRAVRPRPLVDVSVISPAATLVRQCLLDSGADDTLFLESWAPLLGIDLGSAPVGTAAAAGVTLLPLR